MPVVDYGVGTVLLFSMIAKTEMIDSSIGAQLLLTIQKRAKPPSGGKQDSWEETRPSWVLDRSCDNMMGSFSWMCYNTGGNRNLQFRAQMFYHNDRELTLSGIFWDRVKLVVSQFEFDVMDDLENLLLSTTPSAYGGYNERMQALWKTLIADSEMGWDDRSSELEPGRWPIEENGASYEIWRERASPWRPKETHTRSSGDDSAYRHPAHMRFAVEISTSLVSRSVIVSEKGSFAMGSPDAEVGDNIVVFPGIQMPFVIRERSTSLRYQIIGPAYVHSIMDGKAITALDEGKHDLENFVFD